MKRPRDIKVVLRSPEGLYLAGGPEDWAFTEDVSKAALLNYLADDIENQVKRLREEGQVLEPVQAEAQVLSEQCDHCKITVAPLDTFFDGIEFYCPDCVGAWENAFPA